MTTAITTGGRGRGLAAALAVAVAVVLALPARAQEASLEYAVKAQFLYKLGPFIDWPAQAFVDATGPVNLCIAGPDPFGAALDRAISGQHIGDRPIALTRLAAPARGLACHILFIGSDPRATAAVIALVRGTPVLTVTDGIRDPAAKGIINFVIQANRVRFEIDDLAAAENGLDISSKVLSLAVSVRPRS